VVGSCFPIYAIIVFFEPLRLSYESLHECHNTNDEREASSQQPLLRRRGSCQSACPWLRLLVLIDLFFLFQSLPGSESWREMVSR
jgi:hypothetical protein